MQCSLNLSLCSQQVQEDSRQVIQEQEVEVEVEVQGEEDFPLI